MTVRELSHSMQTSLSVYDIAADYYALSSQLLRFAPHFATLRGPDENQFLENVRQFEERYRGSESSPFYVMAQNLKSDCTQLRLHTDGYFSLEGTQSIYEIFHPVLPHSRSAQEVRTAVTNYIAQHIEEEMNSDDEDFVSTFTEIMNLDIKTYETLCAKEYQTRYDQLMARQEQGDYIAEELVDLERFHDSFTVFHDRADYLERIGMPNYFVSTSVITAIAILYHVNIRVEFELNGLNLGQTDPHLGNFDPRWPFITLVHVNGKYFKIQ